MSKNILIFSASPRKGGNSDMLCDRFMQGAQEAGHTVEKIVLWDKTINYCLGCDYCKKHDGKCVHKDDMAQILDKILAAHVLVLASPVYFYTMDAQMKTLIDRTYARYTEIRDKELYYIISAADTDKARMSRTIESFRGFLYCLEGSEEKGIVYGLGAWEKGAIKGNPAMDVAYTMGKEL